MSVIRWQAVAIAELKAYEAVRNSLNVLPDMIERQNTAISRIRTNDPAIVSGTGGGGRNDALISAVVYRDELEQRKVEAQKTVDSIGKALDILTDEEFFILDVLYIHPRKNGIDLICEEQCIEKSAVYNRRNSALEKFTMAMYGVRT